MPIEITMPQLSDTMDEGTILAWRKSEGDVVSRGEALAEVATDKADLEIESFHEGTLLKIYTPQGAKVRVGTVIAVIGEAGEQASEKATEKVAPSAANVDPKLAAGQPAAPNLPPPGVAEIAARTVLTPAVSTPTNHYTNGGADERVKISPLAKNIASSFGLDYRSIQGTGDGGRIVRRDVETKLGTTLSPQEVAQAVQQKAPIKQAYSSPQFAPATPPPATPSPAMAKPGAGVAPQTTEVLSRMRQTIAERMVESVTTAPHFYVTARVDVDELIKMRETLKALPQYEGVTFNHMVIKACGLALRQFPRVNAFYQNGSIVHPQGINIGIITALPDGLLIPVLKNADAAPLSDIVSEGNALVQRARSGRPKSEDLLGGTFSISNIGRVNVENFTAIINPGQGAILAVAGIQAQPVVRAGAVVPGNVMNLTLSVDHRVNDGVLAGQFLSELKRLLENPILLLA